MGKHWLDKHIKEQKHNRDIVNRILGGKDAADVQEMAQIENWDRPKRTKRKKR